MKNLFILFLGILTFTANSPVKKSNWPAIQQGIEGHVYEVFGNQMPSPNRQLPKPKPLQTTIFIYELTSLRDVTQINGLPLYSDIRKKIIATIESDSTGYFKAFLPAGKYSLFVKYKNLLFANSFDAENNIHPVIITEKKFTTTTIKVDVNATY